MFKKRETVIQNIAYLGLMAAVNVIFVLLTAALPPLMFILIFVLPLASTVVTVFCKKKYYPIYFIATVALCLLVSCGLPGYIYDTLFYVIPSLITGFIFGLLIEKHVSGIHVLTSTTLIQYVLTYLTFLCLGLLLPDKNFFDVLLGMFGLQNFQFKEVFAHVFCFLIAGIQILFTYVIIKHEVKKLGIEVNLNDNHKYISNIASIVGVILAVSMYFVYAPLVYVFIFVSLYYFVYQITDLFFKKSKLIYVLVGLILLASIFLFAFLYSYPIKPLSIILLSIPFGLINVVHFTDNCLIKNKNCIK